MEWFIFALLSPILVALSNIIDKFMFSRYIKSPYSFQVFLQVTFVPILILFSLFFKLNFDIFSLIGIIYGVILLFVYVLYNKSMIKEEASRVAALSYLQPIFVLVFAFLILNEAASLSNILGILLLVLSAVLVSYKKINGKFKLSSSVVKMMVVFNVIIALAMVAVRWSTNFVSPYQFMFWAFAGSQPAGYFLLLSKRIRKSFLDESKKMKAKGWTILFIGSVFYFIGIILLYVAISMQNVALVTAVGSAQPFFVFLYALALSVFRPGIVKEDLSKATLSMKIISCVLIILGSWLVVI